MAQVVEHQSSKCNSLSSNPSCLKILASHVLADSEDSNVSEHILVSISTYTWQYFIQIFCLLSEKKVCHSL
jgi:hypothetical protein